MRALVIAALLGGAILPVVGTHLRKPVVHTAAAARKRLHADNGPFGFYGNIWCEPSEASYMRNLSAQLAAENPEVAAPPRSTRRTTSGKSASLMLRSAEPAPLARASRYWNLPPRCRTSIL